MIMKKILLLSMFAVIAAAAFTSCKKNKGGEETPQYTITVTPTVNGTASANKGKARENETVTLTAEANTGYEFSGWSVTEGGMINFLPDASTNPATFTMPAGPVVIEASFAPADVLTAITDPAFKAYALFCMDNENVVYDYVEGDDVLYPKWDKNGDGILSPAEAADVEGVWVDGGYGDAKIKNAAGIEYFTGAKMIGFDCNELKALDVSKCTGLKWLFCSSNQLTSLSISGCAELAMINCPDNKLTTLDVSKNTALNALDCSDNSLSSLNVSNCPELEYLWCRDNDLTVLNVSGIALVSLVCSGNQLAAMDLSGCTTLTTLRCANNLFSPLDISDCPGLAKVYCGNGAADPMTVIVGAGAILNSGIEIWALKNSTEHNRVAGYGAANITNGVTVESRIKVNGVTWAEFNVDAPGTFAAKPEDFGMFYQWNRKKGWASTGTVSGWDAEIASGTSWAETNDPCPKGWRVPTGDEQAVLFEDAKVSREWTTAPTGGYKFTDKTSGNTLFLPAAGSRKSSSGALDNAGNGIYFASTLSTSVPYIIFFSSAKAEQVSGNRAAGFSVRCVLK